MTIETTETMPHIRAFDANEPTVTQITDLELLEAMQAAADGDDRFDLKVLAEETESQYLITSTTMIGEDVTYHFGADGEVADEEPTPIGSGVGDYTYRYDPAGRVVGGHVDSGEKAVRTRIHRLPAGKMIVSITRRAGDDGEMPEDFSDFHRRVAELIAEPEATQDY